MSLSHQRTLAYLDKLGETYDEDVKEWQSNVEQAVKSSKVAITCTALLTLLVCKLQ